MASCSTSWAAILRRCSPGAAARITSALLELLQHLLWIQAHVIMFHKRRAVGLPLGGAERGWLPLAPRGVLEGFCSILTDVPVISGIHGALVSWALTEVRVAIQIDGQECRWAFPPFSFTPHSPFTVRSTAARWHAQRVMNNYLECAVQDEICRCLKLRAESP